MNWKRLYLITVLLFCIYTVYTQRLLSRYETINNKLQKSIVNLMMFCIDVNNKGTKDLEK